MSVFAKLNPRHFFIVGALIVVIIVAILVRKWAVYLEANKAGKSGVKADENQSEADHNDDDDQKSKETSISNAGRRSCSIRTYAMEELMVATKDFKVQIGVGGTSLVYLAELADGRLGAVKRVLEEKGGSQKMFLDEVSVLLRISHPNLVGLLGFCLEKGKLIFTHIFHNLILMKSSSLTIHALVFCRNPACTETRTYTHALRIKIMRLNNRILANSSYSRAICSNSTIYT